MSFKMLPIEAGMLFLIESARIWPVSPNGEFVFNGELILYLRSY